MTWLNKYTLKWYNCALESHFLISDTVATSQDWFHCMLLGTKLLHEWLSDWVTVTVQILTFQWSSTEHRCLESHPALRWSVLDSIGLYHTVTERHSCASVNYMHKNNKSNQQLLQHSFNVLTYHSISTFCFMYYTVQINIHRVREKKRPVAFLL